MPIQLKQQPPYYQPSSSTETLEGLITQNGTSNPTIQIIRNSFQDTPTPTRSAQGTFDITIPNAFPETTTTFYIQNNLGFDNQITMYWLSINIIRIETGQGGIQQDSSLSNTPFIIKSNKNV